MPRLIDRFDLWIRRARASPDPERQLDYILGALITLEEWFFLNIGSRVDPQPAIGEVDGLRCLLLFSDADRVAEIARQIGVDTTEPPIIAIPSAHALAWCVEERPMGSEGLLVNPGGDAVALPMPHVAAFAQAWQARGGLAASGFWIPNLTTEEEEFWQENGLG